MNHEYVIFPRKRDKKLKLITLGLVVLAIIPLTAFTYSGHEGLFLIKVIDGLQARYFYTSPGTVGDLLRAQNYRLDYNDFTTPPLTSGLVPEMEITLNRVDSRETSERLSFTRPDHIILSSAVGAGKEVVVKEGAPGLKEIVRQIVTINDEVVVNREFRTQIVRAAVPRTLMRGTGTTLQLANRVGAGRPDNGRSVTMIATAYSPDARSCGASADGITSIGLRAGHGIIAVDPRVIPYGTRLYIEGYGYGLAADCGGAIKGNRIDLCFNTHEEAIRFGRRPVNVYILN